MVLLHNHYNNNYSRETFSWFSFLSNGCTNFVLILFMCFTVIENVTTTMIIPDLKMTHFWNWQFDKCPRGPQEIPGACILRERSQGHCWKRGRLSLPQPLPLEASEKTSTSWLDGEGRGNTDWANSGVEIGDSLQLKLLWKRVRRKNLWHKSTFLERKGKRGQQKKKRPCSFFFPLPHIAKNLLARVTPLRCLLLLV